MTHLILLFAIFFFVSIEPVSGQVVINEFMSDNESTLPDEDGDYSDWIELYNNSSHSENLSNYCLSDNDRNPYKWIIPDITIPPYGYLIIFASGKNRKNTGELHTNFKISSNDEALYLVDNSGKIIDQTSSADLDKEQVYTRFPDGSENWFISENPTPGEPNYLIKNHLILSDTDPFHVSPFYLKIRSLTNDTIYYSLDGSIPRADSLIFYDSIFLDYTYDLPNIYSNIPTTPSQLSISYKSWELPSSAIDKAVTFRCATYKNGIRTSRIYTQTYFIDSIIFEKYNLPVISLVTDSAHLFNYDSGIYVPGMHFNADDPEWTGNYYQNGMEWERPVHIEYITSKGTPCFSQDAGIRIHGGKTRQAAQKSLKLYAREEYGKSSFNYKLLPQKSNDKYKRFLLRTTMGAWGGNTVIKDVLAHEIIRKLHIEHQDYQPVVVYLNGEYWGIHTLRDKIDTKYISYTHGCNEDSIDLINGNHKIISSGTNEHYIKLAENIVNNDLTESERFSYLKTQIDMNSFIDYQIAEMFISNRDWPGNNQKLWRPQHINGRWRWIFFDLDAGFGSYNTNMFPTALKDDTESSWERLPVSTFLLRNLIKNQEFVDLFTNRYEYLLKDEFQTSTMITKLNSIKEMYDDEMPHHIKRWNYPSSIESWEDDIVTDLLTFIQERPCFVAENISEYLALNDFGFNCKTITDLKDSLIVAPNPSNGIFYIHNNTQEAYSGNLTITDMYGRIIYIDHYFFLGEYKKEYISLSGIPDGIYILTFSSPIYYFKKSLAILN